MLKEIQLEENDVITSFDAVSLFTRVPVPLAVEAIEEKWDEIKNHTSIQKDMFIEAIELCLNNGYCNFENVSYEQVEGLAMGSPLSAIVAEIVLDKLFTMIKNNFNVKLFVKFVDDSLCIVNRDHVDNVFNFLNSYHHRLEFTCELEENNMINFLDITIIKNVNCTLSFKHHRKSTYTGRIINYRSNQPNNFKINTAKSIIKYWLSVSDASFHEELKQEFINLLKRNDYPGKFIRSILEYVNNKNNFSHNGKVANRQNHVYFSIPFVGPSSFIISKHLKKLSSNVRISFSGHNLNRRFFSKVKDPLPFKKCSGLVYKIDCNDCEGCYIGETKQLLGKRIKQHDNDVTNKRNNTALCEHTSETGHNFDLGNTSIICFEENERKRKIREAIEIIKFGTSVNYKRDSKDIYDNFSPIISRIRHKKK